MLNPATVTFTSMLTYYCSQNYLFFTHSFICFPGYLLRLGYLVVVNCMSLIFSQYFNYALPYLGLVGSFGSPSCPYVTVLKYFVSSPSFVVCTYLSMSSGLPATWQTSCVLVFSVRYLPRQDGPEQAGALCFSYSKDKTIWNLCVDFLVLFCLPVLVGVEIGVLVFV